MKPTTCQICARSIKAKSGLIAHHGYQRPWGEGFQTDSCFGSRALPYEKSRDRIPSHRDTIKAWADGRAKFAKILRAEPPANMSYYPTHGHKRFERVDVPKPDVFNVDQTMAMGHPFNSYPNLFKSSIATAELEAEQGRAEVRRLQKRYDAWVKP